MKEDEIRAFLFVVNDNAKGYENAQNENASGDE